MSQIRGRFCKAASQSVNEYTASIPYDWRLYRHDIAGSIAHARMLAKQGIISSSEADKIIDGLSVIREEIQQGGFQFKTELEDIHMNIEARLIEKLGKVGGKLHTARSRNDQVALDMRLYVKDAISDTTGKIKELQKALLALAESNLEVIMPGFTHLQHAQPVLMAHHVLAYFEMLQRDVERFQDCFKRTDVMPLGSGALAGVTYAIDREFLMKELGFKSLSRNSMDAVSDRDFVIEYESASSLCMVHLSRLAEEIIIWSSSAYGFIELDEAFSTGSSIMPQKKNPDVAELGRGKTGRVFGRLMAMLATMKALPLAYNRDMQEDKEGLFDTVDTLLSTLNVFTGMIETLKVRPDSMAKSAEEGYILATDVADYLVKRGEAFRSAHEITGKLVSYAASSGKTLGELTIKEYSSFSPLFSEDVFSVTLKSSITARDVYGGTAPGRVKQALTEAKKLAESL